MTSKPLLIFDLDDTLVDSEGAYDRALREINLSIQEPEFQKARTQVKDQLGPGRVSARNRCLYFKKLLENQGNFSAHKVLENLEIYEKALCQDLKTQWRSLKRDALLSELKSHFQLAILTNENTRTQLLKLRAIDPKSRYFSVLLTSEEVGVEKPDIRIFQKITSLFPGLKNSDITFVGDSLTNDIEPSLKLGWKAIWTREFQQKPEAWGDGRVTVIENLNDLLKIINRSKG